MHDLFRDSTFGQWLRILSRNRFAKFPEEENDFQLPVEYTAPPKENQPSQTDDVSSGELGNGDLDHKSDKSSRNSVDAHGSEYTHTGHSSTLDIVENGGVEASQKQEDNTDVSNACPDTIIVTWYSPTDPENPRNWSKAKRCWTGFVILFYTFAMYIGSSIYATSEADVSRLFGVSRLVSSLGLSVFVIGYSIGPLLWSPLSEVPAIGRNPPYLITFFLFTILCIPTALVNNFGGLLVLRFLLGFFGGPALATGGASYGDFCTGVQMPYVIALWGMGATFGPSLGPVVSGYAVQFKGWRWSTWELLWLCAPVLLTMFFALPETSADLILLRRAKRLRKLTGRTDIKAESEIRQQNMAGPGEIAFQALIKPWEINIKDPAMLFNTIYTALIYGIYYSFFESFPIVYGEIYQWNLGETGLAFLTVLVGLLIAVGLYCGFFYFIMDSKMEKKEKETGSVPPEYRLSPGLVATFFIPIGLFIFAWTAKRSIPWIASLIGIAISMIGVFVIIQCMLIYLPFSYPKYSGSLFAANAFARGALGAGAILFAQPMFDRLGVDGGVSLLAGLTVLCIPGIYYLYFRGPRLRARSKFAN